MSTNSNLPPRLQLFPLPWLSIGVVLTGVWMLLHATGRASYRMSLIFGVLIDVCACARVVKVIQARGRNRS